MAWYDGLFSGSSGAGGLSDDDKKTLANSGLLQAGLQILGNNSTPGVTPGQALSSGLLGGLNSVQQGSQSLIKQRSELANQQFQQAQQADQVDQMQRRRAIQDLAKGFVKPDGTFDMPGYQQALAQQDPQAAMELHQNELHGQLLQAQTKKAEAEASAKQTREINSGNSIMTQEQQPDGSWKTIATGARFAPQQTQNRYQFVTGADGKQYRANAQTGDLQPVLNADGTPFSAAPKAGAGPGMAGGRQGAAAQIKAFDQRNKMQQEANNGVDSAYKAAETLTGVPEAQLRQLPLDQLEQMIANKGSITGPGSQLIHPLNYQALGTYGTQAAMANAVLNSQGNKPTDADIKFGKDASFAPDKTLGLNARLIRQQIERAQKAADQINTLKTQFDNGGALPAGVTPGGVGIGEVPGSVNQPTATTPLDQALARYGAR